MRTAIYCILMLGFSVLLGQNNNWELGIQSYENKDYSKAINYWTEIEANGQVSFELMYNLGAAYYRNADHLNAKLYFEKALLLDGGNEDALYNLKLVNQFFQDKDVYVPNWDLTYVFYKINSVVSDTVLKVVSLGLILGLLAFWWLRKKRLSKQFVIIIWSISLFIYSWSFFQSERAKQFQEVLVKTPRVVVRSSPAQSGNELFVLHKGAKLRKLKESGEWTLVQLSNEQQGWVGNDKLVQIEFSLN